MGNMHLMLRVLYVSVFSFYFQNPVGEILVKVWRVFQPLLFGLIGNEIDINKLDGSVVGKDEFFLRQKSPLYGVKPDQR